MLDNLRNLKMKENREKWDNEKKWKKWFRKRI